MWNWMKLGSCLLVGAVLMMAFVPVAMASSDDEGDDWIRTSGDILQIALPILGGGATFFTNPDPDKTWDKDGTKQFAYAYGSAWSTTYLLKIIASKARPNGNNRTSFPSGHTMSAFAGAAFIDGRFGKSFGIPAYLLAGFTGYSRVHSEWHFQDDVIAGASIGMMYNWHFVTPQPGKVSILPTVSSQGVGLQVAIGGNGGGEPDPEAEAQPRGAGYDFAFGPAFAITNVSGTPGHNTFDLADFKGNNNPTTTAAASVMIPVSSKGRIFASYGPFESRDEGAFGDDLNFGGVNFPAGTEIWSAWRFYDLRVQYEHAVLENRHWGVRVGAGLGKTYSYTALQAADQSASVLVDDSTYYPYGLASLAHKFSPKLSLEIYGDGVTISDDWFLDTGANLTYRASRAWDFSLGYMYSARKISTDTYYNLMRFSIPTLAVTRYW